jgi:hypothetical protein
MIVGYWTHAQRLVVEVFDFPLASAMQRRHGVIDVIGFPDFRGD